MGYVLGFLSFRWDEANDIFSPQLWDVCLDQDAVDLVRNIQDPVSAAKLLVDHALSRFSTDNLSCMIVRLDKAALLENQNNKESAIGVEGDAAAPGPLSEADKIVRDTKQKIAEGTTPAIGVSASNSGRGHDPIPPPSSAEEGGGGGFKPTAIDGSVEEEPSTPSESEGDSPEATPDGSVTSMDTEASKGL
jgi:protein phosphatase PTC1